MQEIAIVPAVFDFALLRCGIEGAKDGAGKDKTQSPQRQKDESAGNETPPLQPNKSAAQKKPLPPPHSAAERGSRSTQAFELAPTSHPLCQ